MISLQNQLEASLSSALIVAINSHDASLCRNYYSIFANIQRDSEFRAYYYGSRRSSLVSAWHDAKLSDIGDLSVTAPSAGQSTPDFLNTFFTTFLSVLNSERTSISAIFPDPQFTLSSLSLRPSPHFNPRLLSASPRLVIIMGPQRSPNSSPSSMRQKSLRLPPIRFWSVQRHPPLYSRHRATAQVRTQRPDHHVVGHPTEDSPSPVACRRKRT